MKHSFLVIFLLAINIINAQKEYFISSERTMTKAQLNQRLRHLRNIIQLDSVIPRMLITSPIELFLKTTAIK